MLHVTLQKEKMKTFSCLSGRGNLHTLSRMQLFDLEHRQENETVFNPIKNGKEFLNGHVLSGSGIGDVSKRPFL